MAKNDQSDLLPTHRLTNGATALGPSRIVQHVHGVSVKHGNVILAGGDIILQSSHQSPPDGPNANILDVLRLVPNLRLVHSDVFSKATPGTGLWLLNAKDYLLWIDWNGNLRILWGTGNPGAGKTVMAAIVIHDLEARAAAAGGTMCVAYIYFRYSDATAMTVRDALEVLVKQAVERHPQCASLAAQVYARHIHESTRPMETELLQLLQKFTETVMVTFYVLDALDEAPEKLQVTLIKKLSSLSVRLFITSRPLKDVEAQVPNACSFTISAQAEDLDLHIKQEIGQSRSLQGLLNNAGPSFKEELIASVKRNCGGMFLHASLQLDAISRCTNLQDVIDVLEEFPTVIESVYRQTWHRICQNTLRNVRLAKIALVWVLSAARSMTIDELRHAIATSPDDHKFERKRLVPTSALVTLCCGLVIIEEETKFVRLVHYTAKATLQELLNEDFPHPHCLLSKVCLAYLVNCGFQNTTIASEEEYSQALREDPLLAYATYAWDTHCTREALADPEVHRQTVEFISGCKAFPSYSSPQYLRDFDFLGSLHVIARFNLPLNVLPHEELEDPNVTTRIVKHVPLMLASQFGNVAMVRSLLLHPDIHVNHGDRDGTSALMLAAESGQEEVVEMLLAHSEINVNMVDIFGRAALVSSSQKGHLGVIALLLDHPGLQINLVNSDGWSALTTSLTGEWHEEVIKLLLAHPNIDVNLANTTQKGRGWTTLMEAAKRGAEGAVKLLLEHPQIDVNAVDITGASALVRAAQHGQEGVLRLLLARPEIDVNKADHDGWSPLMFAVSNNQEGVLGLLLAHPGIRVDLFDNGGYSAVMLAQCLGHEGSASRLRTFPGDQAVDTGNMGFQDGLAVNSSKSRPEELSEDALEFYDALEE